ncbi:DUF4446 family protein [Desulfitobacterium sp. Sab5]|uniref:DUF4446 family protein n=1 Tax=Desulfitobacterium TaxID=36853 RepID=UPI003CE7AF1A
MDLVNLMQTYWWVFLSVILVLVIIPYFLIYALLKRLKRYEKAHISIQTFMSGKELDKLLDENLKNVKELGSKFELQNSRLTKTEEKLRQSVDRAELVRFNAFENMGSNLSFSLALLNQEGNGVVISSINSREESRVYAKPIEKGQSSYHLSAEEIQALEKAQKTLHI